MFTDILERRLLHEQRENSELKEIIYQNKKVNQEREEKIEETEEEEIGQTLGQLYNAT